MLQPTAAEQYMLELINGEREQAGVQPLAFNAQLTDAAEGQDTWMLNTGTFSHVGNNGSDPTARIQAAGYTLSGTWADGENIAWISTSAPAGITDETLALNQNLMNSPEHRANLLNPTFSEVGIAVQEGAYQGIDSVFTTEDFAHSGSSNTYLTGVAFRDANGNGSYEPGEGLAGIKVTATNAAGQSTSTTTMNAGGYQIALAPGQYNVTFAGTGIAANIHHLTVGDQNVALDLVQPASGGVPPTVPPVIPPVPPVTLVSTGDKTTTAPNGQVPGTDHVSTYSDGHHVISGVSGERAVALGHDTFSNDGHNIGFVFRAGVGSELITDFRVSGRGRDCLVLPPSQSTNLGAILGGATDSGGEVTLHVGQDSITLQGVTAAQLKAHPHDFRFHG